jgi:hypothetical protein
MPAIAPNTPASVGPFITVVITFKGWFQKGVLLPTSCSRPERSGFVRRTHFCNVYSLFFPRLFYTIQFKIEHTKFDGFRRRAIEQRTIVERIAHARRATRQRRKVDLESELTAARIATDADSIEIRVHKVIVQLCRLINDEFRLNREQKRCACLIEPVRIRTNKRREIIGGETLLTVAIEAGTLVRPTPAVAQKRAKHRAALCSHEHDQRSRTSRDKSQRTDVTAYIGDRETSRVKLRIEYRQRCYGTYGSIGGRSSSTLTSKDRVHRQAVRRRVVAPRPRIELIVRRQEQRQLRSICDRMINDARDVDHH